MLKKRSTAFLCLWRLTDILLTSIIFYTAYFIRFQFIPVSASSIPSFLQLFENLLIILLFWIFYSNIYGLYISKRLLGPATDWKIIIKTITSTIITYAAVGFVFKNFDISRVMLGIFAILNVIVLGFFHQAVRLFLLSARKKGYNKRSLLIVGVNPVGIRIADHFQDHPEYGYQVLGFIDDKKVNGELKEKSFQHLGNTDVLMSCLEKGRVDRVMIALPWSKHKKIAEIASLCEFEGVEANIVPDLFRFIKPKTKVIDLDGLPIIGVRANPVDSLRYIYLKRLFDIAFSLTAMILLAPVYLFIITGIKLSSKGPVIFKQKRISASGREFEFYKFRSMRLSSDEVADKTWTTADDSRKTRFGTFLRKTCLDELPQFYNVLKGDMSVVGPRPERPYFAKQFKQEVPKYMVRHQVKTGITGWAQVNGYRGDTSIEKRIEYDLFYIENWSFFFDIKIIWFTLFRGINGKNAY